MPDIKKEWVIPMGYKIKKSGVFHIEYLYKDMQRWFEHFGYNWKEIQYRQETQPDGTIHLEIRWTADRALNNYLSFVIDTEFLIFMKDIEIEEKGKKIKRKKGSVELRMGAAMGKNMEIWKKSNQLRKMYDNFLIRQRYEDMEEDLYIEVHKLFAMVKKFLELHS